MILPSCFLPTLKLTNKGGDGTHAPHLLVMSATPIPRSLALVLYGDLDLSVIDEMPPGRLPVNTRIVSESKREAMYGFLRDQLAAGRQAYIVCPHSSTRYGRTPISCRRPAPTRPP